MAADLFHSLLGHFAEGLEFLGSAHNQEHLVFEEPAAAVGKHVELPLQYILDPHHLHADGVAEIGLGHGLPGER